MSDDWPLPRSPEYFLDHLAGLQTRIRARLVSVMDHASTENLSSVADAREGDTVFSIDLHAEEVVHEFFSAWGGELPVLLVSEGIPGDGGKTYPPGTPRNRVAFTCIVDPIDGTRGLMYSKRSAWALAGIAPAPRDSLPTLDQIQIAMQTELPTPRSSLSDTLWAVRGSGVHAETHDIHSGNVRPFTPRPSTAETLLYGFATVTKFFPGGKVLAAEIEERLASHLFGQDNDENPRLFDDEYISSGGQLYELTVGHDRFIADLRPILQAATGVHNICSHPYDLCTELIAREAGVPVTDLTAGRLRQSLDIREDCGWIGYANTTLQGLVEPVLFSIIKELGLKPESG